VWPLPGCVRVCVCVCVCICSDSGDISGGKSGGCSGGNSGGDSDGNSEQRVAPMLKPANMRWACVRSTESVWLPTSCVAYLPIQGF
jgi:hypothetical protein